MTARRGMEHKVQRLIPNHGIVWVTYEKTAATTTNAIKTIAASRPVNASSFFVNLLMNCSSCYRSPDERLIRTSTVTREYMHEGV